MKAVKHILIALLITAIGCKTTKTATSTTEDLASAKIIKEHYNTHISFKTLAARLKVRYEDNNSSQNVTISLRMQKDETIWMSASVLGFSVAKAKITPNRVQYYEKIGKTYFDGDFSLLSKLLGVPLDYSQLEALLLGKPLYNLQNGNYLATPKEKYYVIEPKQNNAAFLLAFYLNPSDFTLGQQRMAQNDSQRYMTVTYTDYKSIKENKVPQNIAIEARDKKNVTTIEMDYRDIETDIEVRFPFTIPDGYNEIFLQ